VLSPAARDGRRRAGFGGRATAFENQRSFGKEKTMLYGVFRRCLAVILVGLLIGLPAGVPVYAQAPAAGGGPPPAPLSGQQLEELVGRIALYPDDLVAIILPASTFPLDIVQADRFLQKLKQDKNLKPDTRWDESIRNLLNYPEVISMMSQNLDWTQDLGEAMVGQQSDVLKAIQAFRAKAQTAGSLKTDDKQIIVQEKEVIKIVPADPEVIYVPQYQPSTVVVQAAPPCITQRRTPATTTPTLQATPLPALPPVPSSGRRSPMAPTGAAATSRTMSISTTPATSTPTGSTPRTSRR
jgi:hypothetical protein